MTKTSPAALYMNTMYLLHKELTQNTAYHYWSQICLFLPQPQWKFPLSFTREDWTDRAPQSSHNTNLATALEHNSLKMS